MTRSLPLVVLALLGAAACSAPEPPEATGTPAPMAPPPTPAPVAVYVQMAEEPEPAVEAWAQALVAAIETGQGDLVLAATPEEAAATVRIDAVESGVAADPEPEGEGEIQRMQGALVVGDSAREFTLVYRGEVGPQAEALARNLRRFAAEGAAPAGPEALTQEPAGPEGTDTEPDDEDG